jgi:TRAP-type C4-dicarboxylate transport system permease large subunit
MIEVGMLTPPVGMNLFVLVGISKHQVNLAQASIGALPYWLLLMLGLVLLTAVPDIATWLPSLSYK